MHARLLALALVLSQVPPIPLPCAPSDGTVVCGCKQQSASACEALAAGDPEAMKGILRLALALKAAQAVKQAEENSADSVDTGCGTSQSPEQDDEQAKCTGQMHHIISKTVWRALQGQPMLKDRYQYRDPRFVAQAKDLKAHCGWEGWHRKLDDEIAKWVVDRPKLTPEEFEAYLREMYARPELRARFPNGF